MTKGEQTILRLVLTGEKRRMNEDIIIVFATSYYSIFCE